MAMAEMAAVADEVSRLKREDLNWTKYDSQFSEWKLLIGPQDWEDYSAGKAGVSKYRLENLPGVSNPGVYELAVYHPGSSSRDHPGKVDPLKVVVVFIGEAINVRARLQQHGRTGSRLCGSDDGEKSCPRLDDIFKRGYGIAYRWIPMKNKVDAQRKKAKLLDTFDYAWNNGSNGARRHEDILQKLDKRAPNPNKQPNLSRKQAGIKGKASKLALQDNELSKYADGENYNSSWEVLKFSRSLPRLVLDRGGFEENDIITCGVVLEDGSICGRPPAEGRKRCAEHKGMQVTSLLSGSDARSTDSRSDSRNRNHGSNSSRSSTDGGTACNGSFCPRTVVGDASSSTVCGASTLKGAPCQNTVKGNGRCYLHSNNDRSSTSSSSTCGAPTLNGAPCQNTVKGNGRCYLHSNNDSSSTSSSSTCGAPTLNGAPCQNTVKGNGRCHLHLNNGGSSTIRLDYSGGSSSICGAPTCDGAPCQRTVNGGGRCWQHSNSGGSSTIRLDYGGGSSSICGAPTCNGAPCQRTVNGGGRCWQHSNTGGSSTSRHSHYSSSYSYYGGGGSSICGARTRNGGCCQRTVNGGGRCWQH